MKIKGHQLGCRELILFLTVGVVVFNIYCLAYLPPSPYIHRGIFMSIFIILAVLLNPPKSKIGKISMVIFTLMALTGSVYPMIFDAKLTSQFYFASEDEIPIFIIFMIGFAGILTRIDAGRIILVLIAFILFYLFLGQHLAGVLNHPPLPLYYIASILYTSADQGVFGFFTEISCRLLSIFIIFSMLLVVTGLGDLATAAATWVSGNATGGPAKVAVFSSGAFGMLSGAAIANVAATGSFTIPIMKRVGYKPSTAASIEALASSGGGLVPPIMASVAFVMAEILGIPYLHICLAALIPAFLWYYTLFIGVHYVALRQGIKKWRPAKEEFLRVIRARLHLVFAVFALIGALFYFASAEQAAFFAVISLVILSFVRKETRLTKAKLLEFLDRYARTFTTLFILIAGLGIFIGGMLGPGLHHEIGELLLGEIEEIYLLLLISFVFVIVLGMAIPNIAAYLAGVVVIAPVLIPLGSNPLLVHMFVFYVAIIAPVTPPVCLASFTAARIAGSDMMKTGVEATIRGLPLWIIPFAIFKKGLMFGVGTPLSAIAIGVAILGFGIFMFVLGVEGYFRRKLKTFERILAIVVGVMIVQPVSDLYSYIFVGIAILLLAYWFLPHQKTKAIGGHL